MVLMSTCFNRENVVLANVHSKVYGLPRLMGTDVAVSMAASLKILKHLKKKNGQNKTITLRVARYLKSYVRKYVFFLWMTL